MLHINFTNVDRAISAITVACANAFGCAAMVPVHLHSAMRQGHVLRWYFTAPSMRTRKRVEPVEVTSASQLLGSRILSKLGLRLCPLRVPTALR